ncbi:hypothetical protein ACFWYW_58055 [Nonomuraea sp. NPDC059023]|uniref:hypothetical protein n=1 Tax=unclassified Nonomuraea TaxID=2593643 RepID=UPI003690B16F
MRERDVTRGCRYLISYEVREASRIAKDRAFDTELRCGSYPLADQGKDRAACLAGIKGQDRPCLRQECLHLLCLFALTTQAGRARALDRFENNPGEAALPLMLEEVAIRLNPTQGLAGMDRRTRQGLRLRDLMAARTTLTEYQTRLQRNTWALHRVQRATLGPATFHRSVQAVHAHRPRPGRWLGRRARRHPPPMAAAAARTIPPGKSSVAAPASASARPASGSRPHGAKPRADHPIDHPAAPNQ